MKTTCTTTTGHWSCSTSHQQNNQQQTKTKTTLKYNTSIFAMTYVRTTDGCPLHYLTVNSFRKMKGTIYPIITKFSVKLMWYCPSLTENERERPLCFFVFVFSVTVTTLHDGCADNKNKQEKKKYGLYVFLVIVKLIFHWLVFGGFFLSLPRHRHTGLSIEKSPVIKTPSLPS